MSTSTDPSPSNNSALLLRLALFGTAGLVTVFILWLILGRTLALAQAVTPVPYTISNESPFAVVLASSNTPPATATVAATPVPTITFTPTLRPTVTPIPPTATATLDPACAEYRDNLDLLTPVVNRDIALDKSYVPPDLESPKLAYRNAYIVPTTIRHVVIQPLLDMLTASNNAGLQIMVVSGYRSWVEQQAAHEKWSQLYPDRVDSISAMPGHSEHQLGYAIDFSTPYMEGLYQNLFHTNFFYTNEGKWLNDNAAKFGFTLSFPSWGIDQTGYAWEPWHYRYVGVALAQELVDRHITLIEYIRECSTP